MIRGRLMTAVTGRPAESRIRAASVGAGNLS